MLWKFRGKRRLLLGGRWGGGNNREIAGGLAPSGRRIPQEQSLGGKKMSKTRMSDPI